MTTTTLPLPLFQYLADHPSIGKVFDEGMRSRGVADDNAIVAAYDFSESSHIVDVGGGSGQLLSTILKSTPQASGVLFDLPHVLVGAQRLLAGLGTNMRIEYVEGDFFENVPGGGDLYLLKQIIHDWTDDRATRILVNCRRAMTLRSKILIFELIIAPDSIYPKLLDLMMLVWTGGRERTREQYEQLLANAGLRLVRVIPTGTSICVFEAVPSEKA